MGPLVSCSQVAKFKLQLVHSQANNEHATGCRGKRRHEVLYYYQLPLVRNITAAHRPRYYQHPDRKVHLWLSTSILCRTGMFPIRLDYFLQGTQQTNLPHDP
jgi:hypothetical protein